MGPEAYLCNLTGQVSSSSKGGLYIEHYSLVYLLSDVIKPKRKFAPSSVGLFTLSSSFYTADSLLNICLEILEYPDTIYISGLSVWLSFFPLERLGVS